MSKTSFPLPLPLLLLDGIGALLFALGAAGHFGNVALLTRWFPQVPQANLSAMIVGGLLMAVAMVGIMRAALRRAREARAHEQGAVQPGLARPPHDRH